MGIGNKLKERFEDAICLEVQLLDTVHKGLVLLSHIWLALLNCLQAVSWRQLC